MQEVLIATTCSSQFENASAHIKNKSLLYDKDKDKLYIKYNDEMRLVGSKVDNDNIILNGDNEISLADNVHCKTLTVAPDDSGIVYKDNVVFAETTDAKRIVLLFKLNSNETIGTIGGKFYENGNYTSGLSFSASVSGSRYVDGSSTGDMPKWCRCTYHGIDYLGLRFNTSTKIYFSGYEYLKDEYKVDFEYTDSTFTSVKDLVDNANQSTDIIEIESNYRIDWDFKSYVNGLDENHATIPNTEYDLSNGLVVNSDFSGQVYFHPTESLNGDIGYITPSGTGYALKLNNGDVFPKSLKIYFSSNTDGETGTLAVYDVDGNIIASAESSTTKALSTLKTDLIERGKTYYIGTTSSRLRIYKMSLLFKNATVIPGWDAFSYAWEFQSIPTGWVEGESTDFENGLNLVRYEGQAANLYGSYSYTDSQTQNDVGYIAVGVPSGGGNIFTLDVPHDNSNFELWFTTDRNGGARTCAVYGPDGSLIDSKVSRYTNYYWGNPTESGMIKITLNNLSAGTYSIWSNALIRVYRMSLDNSGKETEITYGDDTTVENTVDIIENLEEVGEGADAHYITLRDVNITLADLEAIANQLRNSDKPIHLDLSECLVADDAKEWGALFNKCTSLTFLAMPQGVTSIGPETFVGCIFLKNVIFPESLETFMSSSNEYIFSGTRIRTFLLPPKCSKISWNTFANSGARNVIVPPDSLNTFYSMLTYGSFFNTLDYIRIYMTQEQYNTHDWTQTWEHSNFFGDANDSTIAAHIIIYDDLDVLLDSLKYKE